MLRFKPFLLFGTALCLLSACKDTVPEDENAANTDSTKPKVVAIVKGEHGRAPESVALTVKTPAKDEVIGKDSVKVIVDLQGYMLGLPTEGEQSQGINYSKDGQHIHVIIDDKPYMAMYDPEGFMTPPLPEGPHTLRAFPSRSWHESLKLPGAFVAHTFYVGKKGGEPALHDGAPLLTYSRPKGDYKEKDAQRVLLDFYISNCELGKDKFKVIAAIDGQAKDTLTEWVPYFIEGLSDGEHTVKLQLIDPAGQPVPGAFNSPEGKIRINPAAAAAPAATHQHDSGMKHDSGKSPAVK